MALQVLPATINMRDAKGFVYRSRFHVTVQDTDPTFPGDAGALVNGVVQAVLGLTNCAYQGTTFALFKSPPTLTYGDNLEYPAGFMKAVMTFTTDLTTVHRFKIPAPELDIFDVDGVTVKNDGSQAQVVAYVAAMKATINGSYISSGTGLALTHFVGGIFKSGHQPRRFNEFIKSSGLVAGEGE